MPSPFGSFISSLFGKRQEAKKSGNDAMAYVYKILMNSLYGRFGINPESTITEVVCGRDKYDSLTQKDNFLFGNKLSEDYYIVSYVSNGGHVADSDWNPPAVQLSAAITACSRIYMYKYISRNDCYYTDTDSVILGGPLPEEEISSKELGKFKMEHFVKKGIFLAPKTYALVTEYNNIIKHKGPAKGFVNLDWFLSQYADPSLTKQITVESKFRIDWHTLNIGKKVFQVNLGTKMGNKRDPIYNTNNIWVNTKPKHVIDYGGQERTIIQFEFKEVRDELASLKANKIYSDPESSNRFSSLEKKIQMIQDILNSSTNKLISEPNEVVSEIEEEEEFTEISEFTETEEEISETEKHEDSETNKLISETEEVVRKPITEYPTLYSVNQPTLQTTSSKKKKKKKKKRP